MEIEKLIEWNPWWEDVRLINEMKGIERPAYASLVNSIDIREITIITGVRRSGKSTLMYQMIDSLLKKGVDPKQILFVNLENKKLSEDSLDDIYESYRENINLDKKAFVFLDEIHRRPGWESWIRKKYDIRHDIKFVVSWSCSYLLKKEYSTLLTGRNITFEVFPLAFEEFLLFKNLTINKDDIKKGAITERTRLAILKNLKDYMRTGGFPEVSFKKENYKMKILEQYFDDIVYKGIVDRYNLNAQKTRDFALFLMTNFTHKISLRGIRNMMNISYDTIKDYISYYKEAFLFFTIDCFSFSMKEQKTMPSKVYCIDNGLRNAVSFKFSADYGKLAENAVFIELKRKIKDVFYWSGIKEVDFVFKGKDNLLTAITVSYTDEADVHETEALLEFRKKFTTKVKNLIIITKNTEKTENGIKFVPLWKWLLQD